jgi:hypothetical protein
MRVSVSNMQGWNTRGGQIHTKMPEQINMRTRSSLGTTIHMGANRGIRTKGRLKGMETIIVGRTEKTQGTKETIHAIKSQKRRIRRITKHTEAGVTWRRKTRGQEAMKTERIRGQRTASRLITANRRCVIIREVKNTVVIGIGRVKRGRIHTTRGLKIGSCRRVQSKFVQSQKIKINMRTRRLPG